MDNKKIEIYFKNTGIKMTCETAEEAYEIYWDMGHRPGFVINGEELKQKGPMKSDNPHVSAYFAGYSRDFFKKYVDEDEKSASAAKYDEDLEALQRKAEEKGLYDGADTENELER